MSTISRLVGREVFDSRGNPTVEVEVFLADGSHGQAIVPSGASVGSFEAVEKRDRDPERLMGRGVLDAVNSVNDEIQASLVGLNAQDQSNIDRRLIELDGTENKSRLGANAILGVSLAALDAASQSQGLPLYRYVNQFFDDTPMSMPVPLINVLNGGEHADNDLKFQEFMLVPVGGRTFRETLRIGIEVFHTLKKKLTCSSPPLSVAVGDEGGFAPNLQESRQALSLLVDSIATAGYSAEGDCLLGLDCAATEFHDGDSYESELGLNYNGSEHVEHLVKLVSDFPGIVSIEDGCSEESWEDWLLLTSAIGDRVQLVGDDIFVTNTDRLQTGIEQQVGNSILVKLNQVGTVSETFEVIRLAKLHGYTSIVSHRSGDTEDTKIADIAVGSGVGQIKTGSVSRSERVAKYNRLLRIEEEMPSIAFDGTEVFSRYRQG